MRTLTSTLLLLLSFSLQCMESAHKKIEEADTVEPKIEIIELHTDTRLIGSLVPPRIAQKIQNNYNRNFRAGEIVAVKKDTQTSYTFGEVMNRAPTVIDCGPGMTVSPLFDKSLEIKRLNEVMFEPDHVATLEFTSPTSVTYRHHGYSEQLTKVLTYCCKRELFSSPIKECDICDTLVSELPPQGISITAYRADGLCGQKRIYGHIHLFLLDGVHYISERNGYSTLYAITPSHELLLMNRISKPITIKKPNITAFRLLTGLYNQPRMRKLNDIFFNYGY